MNDDLKGAMRRERKFQDKQNKSLSLTHEILDDPNYTPDEKVVRLITECHFGKQRAQELVYGKIKYKDVYESKPVFKDYTKYYKQQR